MELSPQQKRALLAPVRCFLLDMDGTFYLGNQLLEGSLDFLSALDATGRTACFLTNNSSKSARVYDEKLARMGVPERYRRVITSGHAAAHYCLKTFPGKSAWVLGNDMLKEELCAMGLRISEEAPDYVLIAYDTTLDYAKMTRVCDLVRAGLPYIATHPDFNCPTETGFIPDCGSFCAAISLSTGKQPKYLGKPFAETVEMVLDKTGFSAPEVAFVGDRLYTDVATGVKNGAVGLLVLTGETHLEDVPTSEVQPDAIFASLGEMGQQLCQL